MTDHDRDHQTNPHEYKDTARRGADLPTRLEQGDLQASNADIVEEGVTRYGEPFVAYLILDGVEQRSHALIEEFERSYVGYFPDRLAFVLAEIAQRHWDGAVGEFLERIGLAATSVRWDYEELWEQVAEWYRVTERLGGVYAFRR